MHLAAYAGASTALATAVVLRAFQQRPNFYSAAVYLSQSNACLMILTNLILLLTFGSFIGLQRLLYGPLRHIEIEQLYERGWFAVTETSLAMTMFREELGGWFVVMFVSLLVGKVWGWIGEGRVEFLEQQPPANPLVFHLRLMSSLLLSLIFDSFMLEYSLATVLEEARPGMMVMFAFEFAVLTVTSTSTMIRYFISLNDALIVKQQTKARIAARRAEIRAARAQAQGNQDGQNQAAADIPSEEDIDDTDIDVPGWEEKGRWIFYLDLATDFCKLVLYLAFFIILTAFHGLPIHIMRDVFLTARSFGKRLYDFVKYRLATKDMNSRYPDVTTAELERENICIICREEMTVWQAAASASTTSTQPRESQAAPPAEPQAQARPQPPPQPQSQPADERLRPKKLPCGHILHFGCLRSWLERQQVCPTCRRSVLAPDPPAPAASQTSGPNAGNQVARRRQDVAGNNPRGLPALPAEQAWARNFTFGPFRITLGAEGRLPNAAGQVPGAAFGHAPQPQPPNGTGRSGILTRSTSRSRGNRDVPQEIADLETRVEQELRTLRLMQNQLFHVRGLQAEADLLRAYYHPGAAGAVMPSIIPSTIHPNPPSFQTGAMTTTAPLHVPGLSPSTSSSSGFRHAAPYVPTRAFTATSAQQAVSAGQPSLPAGMTLPDGWSILPLQPVNDSSSASRRMDAEVGNTLPLPAQNGTAADGGQAAAGGISAQQPPQLGSRRGSRDEGSHVTGALDTVASNVQARASASQAAVLSSPTSLPPYSSPLSLRTSALNVPNTSTPSVVRKPVATDAAPFQDNITSASDTPTSLSQPLARGETQPDLSFTDGPSNSRPATSAGLNGLNGSKTSGNVPDWAYSEATSPSGAQEPTAQVNAIPTEKGKGRAATVEEAVD